MARLNLSNKISVRKAPGWRSYRGDFAAVRAFGRTLQIQVLSLQSDLDAFEVERRDENSFRLGGITGEIPVLIEELSLTYDLEQALRLAQLIIEKVHEINPGVTKEAGFQVEALDRQEASDGSKSPS